MSYESTELRITLLRPTQQAYVRVSYGQDESHAIGQPVDAKDLLNYKYDPGVGWALRIATAAAHKTKGGSQVLDWPSHAFASAKKGFTVCV
jgi:hypothetical protein